MVHIENLIIGAGPGGLQLAHDFKQLGRNYLVLEKAAQAGDFFYHLSTTSPVDFNQ